MSKLRVEHLDLSYYQALTLNHYTVGLKRTTTVEGKT